MEGINGRFIKMVECNKRGISKVGVLLMACSSSAPAGACSQGMAI